MLALAGLTARELGNPSTLLGSSCSLQQQEQVTANIEMPLHPFTFLSGLLGEEHPQGRAGRVSCGPARAFNSLSSNLLCLARREEVSIHLAQANTLAGQA